ncbi:MAG: hypothetical protein HYY37_01210 [Candidatus Aenigmarchaeota archaeon]|nr:hypothetical protein [Candidatus Aenigmarchaeota archaeon]
MEYVSRRLQALVPNAGAYQGSDAVHYAPGGIVYGSAGGPAKPYPGKESGESRKCC